MLWFLDLSMFFTLNHTHFNSTCSRGRFPKPIAGIEWRYKQPLA